MQHGIELSEFQISIMSNRKGRRYNYIYSKLVTDANGLSGFIAYCLYKQEKIAWIEDFRKKNTMILRLLIKRYMMVFLKRRSMNII